MIKWLLGIPPEIGSKWKFYDEVRDPFKKDYVTVTDTKKGYVKYTLPYSDAGSSCGIRTFRFIYRKCK